VYPCWVSVLDESGGGNKELHKLLADATRSAVAPSEIDTATLTRICEIFGKQLDRETRICLLRYSAARAGTCVRPCQLDSGHSAIHFPTPATYTPCAGYPLDLRPPDDADLPVEYLHYYPFDLEEKDIVGWGTAEATSFDLVSVRDRHRERLRSYYGGLPDGWMSPHIGHGFPSVMIGV
jgi:hypothetical protein